MRDIPLTLIDLPDPRNGRREIDHEHVARLAHEIARLGLLHPITVRAVGDRFALVAGNHRFHAFKHLHRDTIPAIVTAADDDQAAELRLTENLQRNQLTPLEEAHQLSELLDHEPEGIDGLARRLNRGATWILDRLDLLKYPPDFQDAIHAGRLALGAAKHLIRIQPPELRAQYLAHAIEHGCSAATARLWAQDASRESAPPPEPLENSSATAPLEMKTTTEIRCFGCETFVDINDTESLRICKPCLQQIAGARNQPG